MPKTKSTPTSIRAIVIGIFIACGTSQLIASTSELPTAGIQPTAEIKYGEIQVNGSFILGPNG